MLCITDLIHFHETMLEINEEAMRTERQIANVAEAAVTQAATDILFTRNMTSSYPHMIQAASRFMLASIAVMNITLRFQKEALDLQLKMLRQS